MFSGVTGCFPDSCGDSLFSTARKASRFSLYGGSAATGAGALTALVYSAANPLYAAAGSLACLLTCIQCSAAYILKEDEKLATNQQISQVFQREIKSMNDVGDGIATGVKGFDRETGELEDITLKFKKETMALKKNLEAIALQLGNTQDHFRIVTQLSNEQVQELENLANLPKKFQETVAVFTAQVGSFKKLQKESADVVALCLQVVEEVKIILNAMETPNAQLLSNMQGINERLEKGLELIASMKFSDTEALQEARLLVEKDAKSSKRFEAAVKDLENVVGKLKGEVIDD